MASSSYDIGASSGSYNEDRFLHHVFLSFRGPDVRKGFIDHLYRCLKSEGLKVFLDRSDLTYGEDIMPMLYQAIEHSRISVVTLSPRYAESKWCLKELVKIMNCKASSLDQSVLPVFYNIEPRDVRHHSGPYREAFMNYEFLLKGDEETLLSYKMALELIGNCRGFSLEDVGGYEGRLVDSVVEEIVTRVFPRKLFVEENIVGRDSIIQYINKWLQDGSTDVEVGMIYGAGGTGKSTISKIVFNNNLDKFEGSCFVANFQKEASEPKGMTCILEQIISDVSKKPSAKISNIPSGLMRVKDAVGCRKTLLILDDVDELTKLEHMFENPGFFHSGSKIIITTRNQELRKVCKCEFPVGELDDKDSVKLFSLKAFQSDHPPDEYKNLSKKFIDYCQGLPLGLCVLASSLARRPQEFWECQLQELVNCPADGIQSILRVSFDSIKNEVTQDLFLDIAHYFLGMKKGDAFTILEGLKLRPKFHFPVLEDRCLVTINRNGKLQMHQLIQEMALDVVRQEDRKKPGNRSRLSIFEDSRYVLQKRKGTENVRRLRLDSRGVPPGELLTIRTDAFTKMQNLELLQLYDVQLTGNYSDFPQEIKWFLWEKCPLSSLPADLQLDELVVLDMERSSLIHTWENTMALESLKVINFSYSTELVRTPDFSECLALERIVLKGCSKLVEIHESITQLSKLTYLNVKGCISLRRIPLCNATASVDAYNCPELVEIGDGIKFESRTHMSASKTDFMGFSELESFLTHLGDGPFGCYKGVYQCGLYSVFLAGDHIEKWFTMTVEGSQLNYTVPYNSDGRSIRALNICCVYNCSDIIARGLLEVHNLTRSQKWLYIPLLYPLHTELISKPYTWLTHWPITPNRVLNPGDELVITFHHSLDINSPMKYGLRILYHSTDHQCLSFESEESHVDVDVDVSRYELKTEPGVYKYWDSNIHMIDDYSIGNSSVSQCLTTLKLSIPSSIQRLRPGNRGGFRRLPVIGNPAASSQLMRQLGQVPSKHIMLQRLGFFQRRALARLADPALPSRQYGTKEGVPSISFSSAVHQAMTNMIRHTVIMKFQSSRPLLPAIKTHIENHWRIKGTMSLSPNWDGRHIVVFLDTDEDVSAALVCPSRKVQNSYFKLFRWTPDYNPKKESTLVTKWIKMPGLPMEFFTRSCVKAIVSSFAKFLDIDDRTYNMNALHGARACVELDVTSVIPNKVWISAGDLSFFQDVIVEGGTSYCLKCKVHGHELSTCRKAAKKSAPNNIEHAPPKVIHKADTEGWQTVSKRKTTPGIAISSQTMLNLQDSLEKGTEAAFVLEKNNSHCDNVQRDSQVLISLEQQNTISPEQTIQDYFIPAIATANHDTETNLEPSDHLGSPQTRDKVPEESITTTRNI